MMSAWGIIPACASAEVAEAIALREGIKSSIPVCSSPLIIESDNALVIMEMLKKDESRSIISFIADESRDLRSEERRVGKECLL